MAEITKAELWRRLLEIHDNDETKTAETLHRKCTLADVIVLLTTIGVVQENEE